MGPENLTLWIAFVAGFLSFISPCCLPLYPSYISYITGISVKELKDGKGIMQKKAFAHTICFMLGFSVIFFALGLSASLVGDLFSNNRELIQKLGGLLVIVMGLIMLGVIQLQILMKDRKFQFKHKPSGYLGSILVGLSFSAGWTPCIGPILSAVLAMGVTNPEKAVGYISAYTLGFGIPFLIMAFFIGRLKWISKYSSLMMKIGGAMMVLTGILLYTDQMTKITIWLIGLYGGFTGF
ncbi:cytochrome C biogenesis protein CcdA [Paenibacillus sp. FSL H7-0326]|uniref:cytochrome c biogenesis CcdA family protein n=1 Tax=Paenibacillus sp. FSL H7-0326 TaxID=1921144 RepID=UPI00096E59ED|nr:cytochrome c biogenesis protein CcdA [Paenibacillus sp. FSL H7-0326]OMC62781.1 cytochrome C biogenesis protein CcdA [Paenibacillus sp. FSL H7-0326]